MKSQWFSLILRISIYDMIQSEGIGWSKKSRVNLLSPGRKNPGPHQIHMAYLTSVKCLAWLRNAKDWVEFIATSSIILISHTQHIRTTIRIVYCILYIQTIHIISYQFTSFRWIHIIHIIRIIACHLYHWYHFIPFTSFISFTSSLSALYVKYHLHDSHHWNHSSYHDQSNSVHLFIHFHTIPS